MHKRSWLLVEDDAYLRVMLVIMLEMFWDNVTVLAFKDGYEAMTWLDKVQAETLDTPLPELALLDIRLPGPTGDEIGYRLRSLAPTADMTIVMMTAFRFDNYERGQIVRKVRPDLFIRKPVPAPDELKILLDNALARRRN